MDLLSACEGERRSAMQDRACILGSSGRHPHIPASLVTSQVIVTRFLSPVSVSDSEGLEWNFLSSPRKHFLPVWHGECILGIFALRAIRSSEAEWFRLNVRGQVWGSLVCISYLKDRKCFQ